MSFQLQDAKADCLTEISIGFALQKLVSHFSILSFTMEILQRIFFQKFKSPSSNTFNVVVSKHSQTNSGITFPPFQMPTQVAEAPYTTKSCCFL